MYKKIVMVIVILGIMFAAGCQTDFTGPSVSCKIMYRGENDNQEYLSRAAGMTAGTGYGNGVMSWGIPNVRGEQE